MDNHSEPTRSYEQEKAYGSSNAKGIVIGFTLALIMWVPIVIGIAFFDH